MGDYKTDVLNQFVVSTPTPTAIVNQSLIAASAPDRQHLLDYHPGTGTDYSIITRIQEDAEGPYLILEPQIEAAGSAWSLKQRQLLAQLKFIPMPEVPLPGRKPVLQMMRSGSGNIRVANSPWYLVYSRIEKTQIGGTLLSDVTLIWEHVDPANPTKYLRPVASCWKW